MRTLAALALSCAACASPLAPIGPRDASADDAGDAGAGDAGAGDAGAGDAGAGDAGAGDAGDAGAVIDASRSVLQHHNSSTRDGLYLDPAFTRAGITGLQRDTGFTAAVDGSVRAQPLFLAEANRDLLLVATENNQVSALDAATGAVVWQRTLGPPIPLSALPCGNIDPLGITGTPVIDPASRTLFLDAMIDQGGGVPLHQIFGLSVDSGQTRPGYPLALDPHIPGFHSRVQNQRGALLLLDGTLYVPYGGHAGDCGDYRGFVVGVPLANPQRPAGWQTRARGGGVWSPGGLSSDGTSVYAATGNTFNATSFGDGESIVRLGPGPVASGSASDEFTPPDWRSLDAGDVDLGGSPALLFDHHAVALGKDGKAYLLDRADLTHALSITTVSSREIIGAAASWQGAGGRYLVFPMAGVNCPGSGITALRIAPPAVTVAWCKPYSGWGSPIAVSPDGAGSFTVLVAGAESDERLHGFDGETGAVVYTGTDALGTVPRFNALVIGGGRLYAAGVNQVLAFKPR